MEAIDGTGEIVQWIEQAFGWVVAVLLTRETLLQVPAVAATAGVAWGLARLARGVIVSVLRSVAVDEEQETYYIKAILPLSFPLVWSVGLAVSVLAARQFGWPFEVADVTFTLVLAWIMIRFASTLLPDSPWTNVIAALVWFFAALSILDWVEPAGELLSAVAITVGETRISLLTVLTAMIVFAVMLWASAVASRLMERRIERLPSMAPSTRVLVGKALKVTLVVLALTVSLAAVGIDLTALAVFSGAVGVGIGFGLQRTVSNLFSGVILLMDRSIKPGDIIEVGGTYGWVASLGARYVEIETRDGTEYLIPNEDIITKQVINWTHQDNNVRLKLPVRVSYDTDLRLALRLMAEAALRPARVLKSPRPNPLVIAFGENSVELELRFWIADVANGIHNISSEVLLEIWDAFSKHGVHVPLPQRDVHIHQVPPIAMAETFDLPGGPTAAP